MIKLYAGTDSYESYTAAKKAATEISKSTNNDLRIINIDDVSDIDQILMEVEGVGMFSDSKVILGKRLYQNKKIMEYFVENFEKLNKYDFILWQDGKADGKLKFTKIMTKNKSIINFELGKPWQLEKWAADICKAKGMNLTSDQIRFLVERTSESKFFIINELKKISIFLSTKADKKLTNDELEKLLGLDVKGDIWKFLEYFGDRDSTNLFKELDKLLKFETNSQYLIAMLSRELSILFKLKYFSENNMDMKEIGLHPFVLQKSIKKVRNFSLDDLKNKMRDLMLLDYKIKSGRLPDVLALKLFLGS